MKFKDKDGNVFEDIAKALVTFCQKTHCADCKLESIQTDIRRTPFSQCSDYCKTNPAKAARLMGYEVVEDNCLEFDAIKLVEIDQFKQDNAKPPNCNYAQVFPDDNKCLCMAYSYSKREDGLHWGHYPYCGDDICPVKHPELLEGAVLEEIPAKQDKPRICEVLGVEVEETFTAQTPWGNFERCVIDENGMAMNFGTNVICHIINHPECIARKTRAEEKEVVEDSNLVEIDQVKQGKEKPPIGIEPKFIWQRKRYDALCEAIGRYIIAGLQPLPEWVKEGAELLKEMNHEYI